MKKWLNVRYGENMGSRLVVGGGGGLVVEGNGVYGVVDREEGELLFLLEWEK